MRNTRPRNAAATREDILAAACEGFMDRSYDDVGLRDIARAAGVDASLIVRYFGSKEDLFFSALQACKEDSSMLDGPHDGFGRRIADQILCPSPEEEEMRGLRMVLRSIGSARATEIVQASAAERFLDPLAEWLGGEDARVRARLIGGLIMGMVISRSIAGADDLDEPSRERLRDRLAGMLQAVVDAG